MQFGESMRIEELPEGTRVVYPGVRKNAPSSPSAMRAMVEMGVRSLLLTLWSWEQFLLRPNRGAIDLFFHLWVDRSRAIHCATLRWLRELPLRSSVSGTRTTATETKTTKEP